MTIIHVDTDSMAGDVNLHLEVAKVHLEAADAGSAAGNRLVGLRSACIARAYCAIAIAYINDPRSRDMDRFVAFRRQCDDLLARYEKEFGLIHQKRDHAIVTLQKPAPASNGTHKTADKMRRRKYQRIPDNVRKEVVDAIDAGMSQSEVSELVGISETSIQNIMRESRGTPPKN